MTDKIQKQIDVLRMMQTLEMCNMMASKDKFPSAYRQHSDKEAALADAIALLKRLHKLPKTKDGVPVFPGETVYTHANGETFAVETTGWTGGVSLDKCYYTKEAAQKAAEETA
jgi:hypothetical protein